MVTVVQLWSLSVVAMLALLVVLIAAQTAVGTLRRALHGRHGLGRLTPRHTTGPGPRRGPGLVVSAPGKG
jgi:hypothetical protein